MTFAHPLYFILVIPVIAYIAWYILRHWRMTPSLIVGETRAFQRSSAASWRVRLLHIPFALRIITLLLIICVLARPQHTNSWHNRTTEGIDIILVVDVSTSMLAEDLTPNRIEAAKQVASDFIIGRPDDNIGLVIFSGEAFMQCPMTTDHNVLLELFSSVSCDMVLDGLLEDGTTVGMGLATAVSHLKDSNAKSKVIVLLTDGSNNCGEISPLTAAEISRDFGIRVYTIGVGRNGMAPYPQIVGGVRTTINIPVEIDATTLQQIASTTGGEFYRATDNNSLRSVYEQIDQLEKTRQDVRQYSRHEEAYQPFALIAALCLILELLLRNTLLNKLT